MILACAVLIQSTSVTDGRTDRRTPRRWQRRAKHSAFARKNLRLQILDREAQTTNKVYKVIIEKIHMAIINLYEIDSNYMALHELSKGRLSHHLINSTSLTAGIKNVLENLERTSPEFELIYKTPNYYYTQAKVGEAIHKESNTHVLLIIIQAPIVLKSVISLLKVWEFTYFFLYS